MLKLPRLRKDTIFRLYLFTFALVTALGVVSVVRSQGAANRRVVEALEKRIADLEARPVAVANPERRDGSATVMKDVGPPSFSSLAQRHIDEPFWIEGHGFNKRYAYLDIEFRDGYRARYYFRPYPSRGELANLHRRIQHDAFSHYFPLDISEDS